jgi:glycosyltransferase involved in cell wall biosynthesis
VIRVAAFTGGRNVPSARYRVRQFIAPLAAHDVAVTEHVAPLGTYPPVSTPRRIPWLVGATVGRIPDVLASHRADVTWLQREFVSTLSTLERWTRAPRVFDVDDALWLLPRGGFAARIASQCDRVIAGNTFLAEYFARTGRPIEIIPTAVDTTHYAPVERVREEQIVIGWSGSSSGLAYLLDVEDALAAVCRLRPEVRVLVMADRAPTWSALASSQAEFVAWSPEREIPTLQRMDIGLMPLRDGPWERGKCSFKMLQYMACGAVPVVSPVGMNVDVLARGPVGLAASGTAAWTDALVSLVDDAQARRAMANTARAVVEEHYSVSALTPRVAKALRG